MFYYKQIRRMAVALMASAVLLVSCAMLEEHQEEAAGYLAAPSLEVDLEVDGTLLTKAFDFDVQEPEVSEITFVVRDKDNNVKYSGTGLWTDPLVLPVGSYSVEASYGTNGFDGPYFTGSAQGTIENNDQEVPALTMSLANALVRVRVGEDFGVHFSPGQEFSLKCGETSKDIETGDWTYIPAGDEVSIELSLAGTNSFADPVTFKYTLDGPSSKCAYDVVCMPDGQTSWPSIGAPKIDDNNVWACMAFITELPQSQNIPEGRKDEIVIEAIPTSGGNTLTAVKDGTNYVFKNLTPGVTYNVRARIGNLTSEATPMTPTVDGLTVSAEHTKNSAGELDGTDVTTSLSKSDLIKDAITTWDIDICRSDGNPLRSDLSLGVSDGSAITDVNGWPYLPAGSYKVVAIATMKDGTTIPEVVSEFSANTPVFAPTIELANTSYTSYDKYLVNEINAANECAPESLYHPEAVIGGISDNLKKNSNYPKKVSFFVSTKTQDKTAYSMSGESITGDEFSSLAWGSHTLTAKFTFDGVESDVSTGKTHHVTGLPYSALPTKIGGWSCSQSAALVSVNWENSYVRLGGISVSPYITSPSFHIPANVNTTINVDGKLASRNFIRWIKTTFTVKVNGNTVISRESQDEEETFFTDLTGNATFTSSAKTMELKSSYTMAGPPYVDIYNVAVSYR